MHCRRFLYAAALNAALVLSLGTAGHAAEPAAWKLFGDKKKAADLNARAIGSYTRGCLSGGKMLPISGPGWEAMKLQRNRNWGHPRLVAFLERLANESREKDGWPGLLIGDLAMPRGGPFRSGHRSHQIGLDADIWYKPKPDHELSSKERADSWSVLLAPEFGKTVTKNWKPGYVKLLKRAASYPETARIFVHPAVKKKLCESAGSDRAWLRRIRPWWKHNYHFHVRLKCPDGYNGCKNQNPPPQGDGCGKPLNYWMKQLEKAEAWSKRKPKEPAKPKPRKQLRMANLPSACRAVLEAPPSSGVREAAATAPLPQRKATPPAPVRASAARATAARANVDPNLPWLKNPAVPSPAHVQVPLPDRKPQ